MRRQREAWISPHQVLGAQRDPALAGSTKKAQGRDPHLPAGHGSGGVKTCQGQAGNMFQAEGTSTGPVLSWEPADVFGPRTRSTAGGSRGEGLNRDRTCVESGCSGHGRGSAVGPVVRDMLRATQVALETSVEILGRKPQGRVGRGPETKTPAGSKGQTAGAGTAGRAAFTSISPICRCSCSHIISSSCCRCCETSPWRGRRGWGLAAPA